MMMEEKSHEESKTQKWKDIAERASNNRKQFESPKIINESILKAPMRY